MYVGLQGIVVESSGFAAFCTIAGFLESLKKRGSRRHVTIRAFLHAKDSAQVGGEGARSAFV